MEDILDDEMMINRPMYKHWLVCLYSSFNDCGFIHYDS